MPVDAFGVRHVLQHHLADLQGSFAEPNFQNLYVSTLYAENMLVRCRVRSKQDDNIPLSQLCLNYHL